MCEFLSALVLPGGTVHYDCSPFSYQVDSENDRPRVSGVSGNAQIVLPDKVRVVHDHDPGCILCRLGRVSDSGSSCSHSNGGNS